MKLLTVKVGELQVDDVLLASYETVLEIKSHVGHREVVTGLPLLHQGEMLLAARYSYAWPYQSEEAIARSVPPPDGLGLSPPHARAARKNQLAKMMAAPPAGEVLDDLLAMAERLRP